MKQLLLKSEIKTENDIVWARKKTRELSQFLRLDIQEQTRLATAVSEMARNTFQYAGRGWIEFNLTQELDKSFIVINIIDKGPGIKDLKAVLSGQYISPHGMGVGISGSRKLVDALDIVSDANGTSISLKKLVANRKTLLSQQELKKLLDGFISKTSTDPIEEIQKQNQEILLTVAALNEKKEELSRLNQELEDTNRGVVALYAELDEKAESLRQANESKTSFLSDMTHEFRSPLNSIISISDILIDEARGRKDSDLEKQVSFIMKAARGLSDLVNDLLDIAKIEAGKIPVRVDKFSVQDLFSTLRGLMRPLAMTNPNIVLNFDEIREDLFIITDEAKVGQILRNLISNAIKYTEAGEIKVSAKMIEDNFIEFIVTDTGIGIQEVHLNSIFSEFIQIENRLQGGNKGTGLGLPLTRKLTQLLGGSISVTSKIEKGSAFHIQLPALYEGPSDAQYVKTAPTPFFKKNLNHNLEKILIVDDDPANRLLLKKILNHLHLDYREASNGLEALKTMEDYLPDLIILDLMMPLMGGKDFIRESLARKNFRDIPIILYTSQELEVEELQYLEQVTALVLQKGGDSLSSLEKILSDLMEIKGHQNEL
jgi:signal transduction histidine kinase